jgi:hypothetical protein
VGEEDGYVAGMNWRGVPPHPPFPGDGKNLAPVTDRAGNPGRVGRDLPTYSSLSVSRTNRVRTVVRKSPGRWSGRRAPAKMASVLRHPGGLLMPVCNQTSPVHSAHVACAGRGACPQYSPMFQCLHVLSHGSAPIPWESEAEAAVHPLGAGCQLRVRISLMVKAMRIASQRNPTPAKTQVRRLL